MKTSNIAALLAFALPAALSAGTATYEGATLQSTPSQGDWMSGFGIGTQLGTQGVGLHLSYKLTPSFYLKAEGNYFEYSDSFDIDDEDYDGDLDFSNLGITANYLPIEGSGFRITAGAFFSQNKFNGITRGGVGQTIEIDDTVYPFPAGDSLNGSVEYDSINPYLGIGWDWAFGESQNIILGFDLGVSYLGDPQTILTPTGTLVAAVAPGGIENETQNFNNDIEDYKFYPVVKLALTFSF